MRQEHQYLMYDSSVHKINSCETQVQQSDSNLLVINKFCSISKIALLSLQV